MVRSHQNRLKTHTILSNVWCNMKMSNNPAKYQVLIKQYLRSILLVFLINIPLLFNNLIYFISERYFPKNREIGSLVVRSWEMTKNCETHGRTARVGRSASLSFAFRLDLLHLFPFELLKVNRTCFSKGWESIKAENRNSRKRGWYLQTKSGNSSRYTRRTTRVSCESQRNHLCLECQGKATFEFWSTEIGKSYGSPEAWQGTYGSWEQGIKQRDFTKDRGISDKKGRASAAERIATGEATHLNVSKLDHVSKHLEACQKSSAARLILKYGRFIDILLFSPYCFTYREKFQH